jgi:hypothetical protein
VICGRPIGEIHLTGHKPALLSPESRTVAWTDVPDETVPAVIRTHPPVCGIAISCGLFAGSTPSWWWTIRVPLRENNCAIPAF